MRGRCEGAWDGGGRRQERSQGTAKEADAVSGARGDRRASSVAVRAQQKGPFAACAAVPERAARTTHA